MFCILLSSLWGCNDANWTSYPDIKPHGLPYAMLPSSNVPIALFSWCHARLKLLVACALSILESALSTPYVSWKANLPTDVTLSSSCPVNVTSFRWNWKEKTYERTISKIFNSHPIFFLLDILHMSARIPKDYSLRVPGSLAFGSNAWSLSHTMYHPGTDCVLRYHLAYALFQLVITA